MAKSVVSNETVRRQFAGWRHVGHADERAKQVELIDVRAYVALLMAGFTRTSISL